MKVHIRFTDRFIFGNSFQTDEIIVDVKKGSLKSVIESMLNSFGNNLTNEFDLSKMFEAFLFIRNGTKVLHKTEYEESLFEDGDTLIIAPLVSGG